MAAGNLSPLNMQEWAIDPHPVRPDGAQEAVKLAFDSMGGMFVAYALRWPWDVCFSQVFGFPLIVFEDDVVNGVLDSGNGGAGLWDQTPPPPIVCSFTWRQLQLSQNNASYTPAGGGDPLEGQLAVNAAFADFIKTVSVKDLEAATQDYFNVLLEEINYYRTTYVNPIQDPGPPPGRVPPQVLYPPTQIGLIASGEGLVGAQASRLQMLYGVVGAIPVPQ